MKARFLTLAICCSSLCFARAQPAALGPLLFEDDFSTSNSVWRFNLVDTQENPSAISASYGHISDGVMHLKANVGCGWDYVASFASLQLRLPDNYAIQYRFRKMQWCGGFQTQVSFTNEMHEAWTMPCFTYGGAGNWFSGFDMRMPTNTVTIPPSNSSQANGAWYAFKIVKRGGSVQVFVDDTLQYSFTGYVPPGGFLHFSTHQAGSTVEIDDVKVFALASTLSIETAAIRVRWFAESNVNYQLQSSTNLQDWLNVKAVTGSGEFTNVIEWTEGPRRFYRLLE